VQVERLELRDFRSYSSLEVAPGPGLNLVTGANAAGKTNLLEAVAVAATGRSTRLKKGQALVRRGADQARVRAQFKDPDEGPGREHQVEVTLDVSGGRRVRLDGKPVRRQSDLEGKLLLVQLFPEDLAVATESPGRRRAFIDSLCVRLEPGYLRMRKELERLLRQRNAALKARRPDRELQALDAPFLDRAARIHHSRARALVRLREVVARLALLPDGEELGLEYWAEARELPEIQELLAIRLRATRGDERRLGSTRVGPHRDDFRLQLGGVPVRDDASRGQLRSLLLRLKLGEAALLREQRGKAPILLLDDALSDMDPGRARETLSRLQGWGQVFLTVPAPPAAPPPDSRAFRIAPGTAEMVV
jgi:DNA replication and repair protein RecF